MAGQESGTVCAGAVVHAHSVPGPIHDVPRFDRGTRRAGLSQALARTRKRDGRQGAAENARSCDAAPGAG